MNIIVNTSALRTSGALSIYLQFINHLSCYVGANRYYIFVDSSVYQPKIKGVTYIIDDNHSWKHRLYWDLKGLKKWLKNHSIVPDVVVSLQNTGVNVPCRQIIYYHQSLPFYNRKWSFFRKSERILWLYKNIYPLFVQISLTESTDVVVQVPYIKKKFMEKFHLSDKKIHVLFPDREEVHESTVVPYPFDSNFFHFVYPASASTYKEHRTLCMAMDILRRKNLALYKKIKIHFTLREGDSKSLYTLIRQLGLEDSFVFEGKVEHGVLLSMYKAACGLVFPSTIETIGLPLLEAASFGLPIVVSDLDYSREVLEGYSGSSFVPCYDYDRWAKEITKICLDSKRFIPIKQKESSWKYFFALIDSCN